MKILTKFILILLSTAYTNTFYRPNPYYCTQYYWAQHSVYSTNPEDYENAERIMKFMEKQEILLMALSNYFHDDNSQVNLKKEPQLKMYILPLWLIIKDGSYNCIIFAE